MKNMKNTIIKLSLFASIVLIAFLVLKPIEQKKHTEQEMANISKAFSEKFSQTEKNQAPQAKKPAATADSKPMSENQQSIIGVIYKQPDATWFIKAKDAKQKIETVSASFKNYFIEQLKFDEQHQPDFSHIPDSMKTTNKSSMRVATFMLGEVEISVSRLAGQQDVFANVKRWMRQIGLDDTSPIQLDFSDDKKTIIVRMPK
jgi:hypothetical protein